MAVWTLEFFFLIFVWHIFSKRFFKRRFFEPRWISRNLFPTSIEEPYGFRQRSYCRLGSDKQIPCISSWCFQHLDERWVWVKRFFFSHGPSQEIYSKTEDVAASAAARAEGANLKRCYWQPLAHGPMDEHVQQSLNLVASRLIWMANIYIFSILKNCAFASHRQ